MNREFGRGSGSEVLAGEEGALVVVPAKEKENGAEEFVAGGIAELGEAMARYSIGEVGPLGLDEVSTGDKIAEALAKVEIDDPSLKIPDTDTDQEVVRVAALAIAKARAVAEASSDPKVKSELYDFGDGVATKVADFLSTPMTRRRFLGSAVIAVLGLALAASGLAKSTVTATTTATRPAMTEAVTLEPTVITTAIPTETPPSEAYFWVDPHNKSIWRMDDRDYKLVGNYPGIFGGWVDEASIPENQKEEGIRWGRWSNREGYGIVRFVRIEKPQETK